MEIFKSQLTGMEVEEAIEKIPGIVGEYIVESSPGMQQFLAYSKQQKDVLAMQGVLTKEERKQVYDAENQLLASLQSRKAEAEALIATEEAKEDSNEGLLSFLRQSVKSDQVLIAVVEEKQKIVTPMEARNKYKEADLWKYQDCFANTLKAAVVTMNKMGMVSFKGEETAHDRGVQGQAIKEATARLRNKEAWDEGTMDIDRNVGDIVVCFDYPMPEVAKLSQSMVDPAMVSKLFNRHMKLAYDAFIGFRGLNKVNQKRIISGSHIAFTSGQGWLKRVEKYPYPNSHENINDEGIFVLPEKFSAAKSRSLTTAIKELESLVKAGIEDQVAEEQSESKKLPDQQTGAEIVAGGGR